MQILATDHCNQYLESESGHCNQSVSGWNETCMYVSNEWINI